MKQIACPTSCSWLGNLAVLSGHADVDVDAAQAAYEDAMRTFAEWAYDNAGAYLVWACDMLLEDPDDEPERWLEALFSGAVRYGIRDEQGRRLLDHYLDAHAKRLPRDHVVALSFFRASWASVFSVEAVSNAVVTLRDLVDEQVVLVKANALYPRTQGEVVYAWVVPFGSENELTVTVVIPQEREALLARYKAALARHAADGKSHRDIAGDVVDEIAHFARRLNRGPSSEIKRNASTRSAMFTLYFRIHDERRLREQLGGSAVLRAVEKNKYDIWRWMHGEELFGFAAIFSPLFEITADTEARANELHAALAPCLGGLVELLVDEQRIDCLAAANRRARRLAILDEPHVDLDGQSPRDACATRMGRMAVDALVRRWDAEVDAVDGDELRAALGIVEDFAEVDPHDASAAKGEAFAALDRWERDHGSAWFERGRDVLGIDERGGRVVPDHLIPLARLTVRHGVLDDNDERLIDNAIEELHGDLPPEQIVALTFGQRAWASLFEIVRTDEKVFVVRDLVDEVVLELRQFPDAAARRSAGDVVYMWIAPWGAWNEPIVAAPIVGDHERVLRTYLECLELEQERAEYELDHRELSAELSDVILTETLAAADAPARLVSGYPRR